VEVEVLTEGEEVVVAALDEVSVDRVVVVEVVEGCVVGRGRTGAGARGRWVAADSVPVLLVVDEVNWDAAARARDVFEA
jgi:hypothetical protein